MPFSPLLLLTQASVAGQLLVDLFHPLYVEAAGLGMVHHGLGVVHPDHTLGHFLHTLRCVPRVVDVLGWESSEYGQAASEGNTIPCQLEHEHSRNSKHTPVKADGVVT